MFALYCIGVLLPVALGLLLAKACERLPWVEMLIMVVVGIATTTIFQYFLVLGMTHDQQVYSGQIVETRYVPAWLESYEYAVYRTETYTDSKGNTHSREVFDHWEPSQRYHQAYWEDTSNIGTTYRIDQPSYDWTVTKFGEKHTVPGVRHTGDHDSHMISGDPLDYVSDDINQFIIPVTDVRSWGNRLKCCPSVFDYASVPKDIKTFPYPLPTDPFRSNRLLGTAAQAVDLFTFDQMCARLGPALHVNVIIVGFPAGSPSSMGHYQEAAWLGGKKNDLVLCYGGDPAHPEWTYCFGWTEKDIVKRNLAFFAQSEGITPDFIGTGDPGHLGTMEAEIRSNYAIKDWKKFDYLTIEPPAWSYFALLAVVSVGQLLAVICYEHREEIADHFRR